MIQGYPHFRKPPNDYYKWIYGGFRSRAPQARWMVYSLWKIPSRNGWWFRGITIYGPPHYLSTFYPSEVVYIPIWHALQQNSLQLPPFFIMPNSTEYDFIWISHTPWLFPCLLGQKWLVRVHSPPLYCHSIPVILATNHHLSGAWVNYRQTRFAFLMYNPMKNSQCGFMNCCRSVPIFVWRLSQSNTENYEVNVIN